jgi:hypothetical protein
VETIFVKIKKNPIVARIMMIIVQEMVQRMNWHAQIQKLIRHLKLH